MYSFASSSYVQFCSESKCQCLALRDLQWGWLWFASLNLWRPLLQSIKILNMIKLFGKPIRVNKSSQDKKSQDVGANLFIGHLDPDVDEKVTLTPDGLMHVMIVSLPWEIAGWLAQRWPNRQTLWRVKSALLNLSLANHALIVSDRKAE